jgi:hypothetical protein
MRPKIAVPFSLTFLFATALSTTAFADNLEGAFRLSLDTTAVEYFTLSLERADTPKMPLSGPQPELTSSQTTVGLVGSGIGIGLGGAVHENVVIGARVSAGQSDTEILSQQSSTTSVMLMPSVEFLFGDGEPAHPFIAVNGGYRTQTVSPGGGTDTVAQSFMIGGGFGAHLFVTPSFSIDPAANIFYTTGSIESGNVKYDMSGTTIWVNIGFSGWIRRPPPIPAAEPPAGTAMPAATAPPPAPAPARVNDDRGRLTTSFALDVLPTDPPGQRLRVVLSGEPRADGQSASVVVTGIVATKEEPACAAAELAVDATTTPFSQVHPTTRAGFSASEVTIEMKSDVQPIQRLAESHGEATITVCGVKRPVSQESRTNVYDWMEQFRAKARSAGTWKDSK